MDRIHQPQAQHSPAAQPWPEGVTHRYMNLAGATVDISRDADGYTSARCTGCPIGYTGDELTAHDRAQQHAEKCRAVPHPQEA